LKVFDDLVGMDSRIGPMIQAEGENVILGRSTSARRQTPRVLECFELMQVLISLEADYLQGRFKKNIRRSAFQGLAHRETGQPLLDFLGIASIHNSEGCFNLVKSQDLTLDA
jgi:hypothetical protein